MFVYQNANRDICVTFKSNKPVTDPEYVIAINHEDGVITINGEEVAPVSTETTTEEPDSVNTTEPDMNEQETTEPEDVVGETEE